MGFEGLSRRPILGGVVLFVGTGLVYALAAWGGARLMMHRPHIFPPIWPASGVALAILALTRRGQWPWVLAGIALAYGPATSGVGRTPPQILVGLIANTAEAALSAVILTRWGREEVRFNRIGDVFRLLAAAGPGTALMASLAAILLWLVGGVPPDLVGSPFEFWRTWLVADGAGMLVITPVILSAREFCWGTMNRSRQVGAAVLLMLTIFWAWWLFLGRSGSGLILLDHPFVLTVPFLIWAGLRADVFITSIVALIFSGCAAAAMVQGIGPFVQSGEPDQAAILTLQIMLVAWTTSGLVIAVTTVAHRDSLKHLSEREQAVRASEQLFRAFIENAPVPIMLAPGPDKSPLYFNPAMTRVFGYTREELKTPADWWPMAYADAEHRAARQAAWKELIEKAERTGEVQDAMEGRMMTRDGQTRFAQVRLAIVQGYRLIFINDLTALRRAEAELRLTQYAVDHNPVLIYRVDMGGRFVYLNNAACEHLGYSREELLTKGIWDVSKSVMVESWPERAKWVREKGATHFEARFMRKDGTEFPVEVRACYQRFDGEDYFFTFAYDITARKVAEEEARSHLERIESLALELTRAEERQRRELASILHDEVGQNLFAATAQLLTLRNSVEAARPVTDKALGLLDQISRDTRNLTFELCPPVLYQLGLAPALQRLVEQNTASYGMEFTLRGNSAGPADLNVRGLAYQAVRELLTNAAKHSSAKHVTVSLAEIRGEEGGWLEIEVADDGAGFEPDTLSPGKNGFGLFHLRERIGLLEGSLTISSRPGMGCRVVLRVPLGPPHQE